MLKYPGQVELGAAMTGQETDTRGALIPYAPEVGNASSEADLVDRAGNAILGLVNRRAKGIKARPLLHCRARGVWFLTPMLSLSC
jgi:hypothetical protein